MRNFGGLVLAFTLLLFSSACSESSESSGSGSPAAPTTPTFEPTGGEGGTGSTSIRLCLDQDQILHMSGTSAERERKLERFFGYSNFSIQNLEGPVTLCVAATASSAHNDQIAGAFRVEFEDQFGTAALPFNYAEMNQTFYGGIQQDADGTIAINLIMFDDYGLVQIVAETQGNDLVGSVNFYNFPSYQEALELAIEDYQQNLTVAQLLGYNFPASYWQTATSINDQQAHLDIVLGLLSSSRAENLGSFRTIASKVFF